MTRKKKSSRAPGSGSKDNVGRKRIEYDLAQVRALAALQCTYAEIATVLGMCETTLHNARKRDPELDEAIDAGRNEGKVGLRKAQFKSAIKKEDVSMQKFLGKNYLGQKDTMVEQNIQTSQPIINLSIEQTRDSKLLDIQNQELPPPIDEENES